MKLGQIVDYIESEADEAELRAILAAYSTGVRRTRALKVRNIRAELQEGDTIIFSAIKPKYLIGQQAKVLEILGDKAKVDMGQPVRRYSRIVTVPLSCIKKVK